MIQIICLKAKDESPPKEDIVMIPPKRIGMSATIRTQSVDFKKRIILLV